MERLILRMRISKTTKDLKHTLRRWNESTAKITRYKFPQQAQDSFNNLRELYIYRTDEREKMHKANKIHKMINKQRQSKPIYEETYQGILVGDSVLREKYGDPSINPIIQGGM